MSESLLVSVRPGFAAAILSGAKWFEFRRTRPRRNSDWTVVLGGGAPVWSS